MCRANCWRVGGDSCGGFEERRSLGFALFLLCLLWVSISFVRSTENVVRVQNLSYMMRDFISLHCGHRAPVY